MKLKILFTLTLLVSVLAGCTQVTDSNDTQGLSGDQTIAYSTYMAGAFLSESTTSQEDNTTSSSQGEVMNLATGSEDNKDDAMLKIEEELGEASEYFNRLKVFLDNGMENPFVIDQDIDVEGDYDITMQYTVEEKTYTILLNEDEDGSLAGTLILDGVEYDVEGYREVETEDEDEDEESDEDDGEDEGSDDESDQEEDTDDDADSEDEEDSDDEEDTEENNTVETEEEIYLKTVDKENSDNYIEITIETETEDEEYEFEMELESYIDNVEKELKIEFEVEDDEVSIELETENGNVYEFSRETEEDTDIDYEFEYEIDGTEGEVDLTVTTDEQGNKVYNYHIEEDGQEKDVKEREDDDDDDEDDEDDQDDEEDEDDDDTDDEDDEEETA